MKKTIVCLAIFLMTMVVLPSVSSATTIEELQAQINSLLAQISKLQAQLAGQTSSSSGSSGSGGFCHTFNTDLKIGDQGNEVSALLTALTMNGVATERSSNFASIFDETMASYVSAFQAKYRSEILTPAGLYSPTGYVGGRTRTKLNALYGCTNLPPDLGHCPERAAPPLCPNGLQPSQVPGTCDFACNTAKVCTTDAKLCSDGRTYVSRTGPNCEFATCPSITATQPSVTVLSPNGGVWETGKSYPITWSTSNAPSDAWVGIVRLYKGVMFKNDIVPSFSWNQPNATTYYSVPTNSVTGNDFKIHVVLNKGPVGSESGVAEAWSPMFSIVAPTQTPAPIISYISPISGKVGDTITVYGSNLYGNGVIFDGVNLSTSVTTYNYPSTSGSSMTFTIPSTASVGLHTIQIEQRIVGGRSSAVVLSVYSAPTSTPPPSISIIGASGSQPISTSITATVGNTFTISGIPQNLSGMSYYYGSGNPPSGYYNRAYFFDQNFGNNNSCGNNEASVNGVWTMTCTAKVPGSSTFYVEIYANGQTYRSNVVTVNIVNPTPSNGAIIPSDSFMSYNVTQGDSNPPFYNLHLTNSSSVSVNFTLSFSPSQPNWLNGSYNTQTMTLNSGGVMGVGVAIDATKVSSPGTYTTNLVVTGNFVGSPLSIPITLTVKAAPVVTVPTSATLTATPNSDGSYLLSWTSTNATSCVSSGDGVSWGWPSSRYISGGQYTPVITSPQTFTITCTGSSGSVTKSVTVSAAASTINPALLSFAASPSSVSSGGIVTFSFSGRSISYYNFYVFCPFNVKAVFVDTPGGLDICNTNKKIEGTATSYRVQFSNTNTNAMLAPATIYAYNANGGLVDQRTISINAVQVGGIGQSASVNQTANALSSITAALENLLKSLR